MQPVKAESFGDYKPNKKYYPNISFAYDQLPKEAQEWEVGKTYTLVLEVKQMSKSESADDNHGGGRLSFDVIKIGLDDDYDEDEEDESDDDDDED